MAALTDEKLTELLNKFSAAELSEWIMKQADGDPAFRREVVSLVSVRADPSVVASELRKMITRAWARSRSTRSPKAIARPIAHDLEAVLTSIEQLMERGDVVLAEKLLRRFTEAANKGMGQVDDSYGILSPVCHAGVRMWGKAWAQIEPRDPAAVATMVFDAVRDNECSVLDYMILDFAAALGRDGLLMLRNRYLAEHQAFLAEGDKDSWDQDRPLSHLRDVADALGDVDLFVDALERAERTEIYALPIARRMFEAGRTEEALSWLDTLRPDRSHFSGERYDAGELRMRVLLALGRDDEATDTLWNAFRKELSPSDLDRILSCTPEDRHPSVIKEAFAIADAYRNRVRAARFFLDRGELQRTAQIVIEHPRSFDGNFYSTQLDLAQALQDEFPAAAWTLYRALLVNILDEKRTQAYGHAAKYFGLTRVLAKRAGLHEKQEALMSELHSAHRLKRSFWQRVEG